MALGGAEGDGPAEERAGTFTLLSDDDPASASGNSDPAATSLTRDGYVKTNLTKWDLLRGTTYRKFRYDKFYHKQDAESFVRDFLNSEDVRRELLPEAGSEDVAEVCSFSAKPVKAVTTTMAFFDRLQQAGGVVRPNGQIVKCMDDYFEGFHVQDRLREVLLNEDNEFELDHGEVFTADEKAEFLYKIFRHLAVGGSLCQFEDVLDPYLEVSKLVYKELLTVWRNPRTAKPEVASGVYEIDQVKFRRRDGGGEEEELFPEHSAQNWLYVSTDPFRRTCKAWLHRFKHHW